MTKPQDLHPVAEPEARCLSARERAQIERQASQAARDGFTRNEACPWPFGDPEEIHWTACFLLKGGKV